MSYLAGLPGNLKTVWLLLLAASFFVSHRLKSPFGSASSSHMSLRGAAVAHLGLQMLETMMRESSSKVAQMVSQTLQSDRLFDLECTFCPLACVQVVFMLERASFVHLRCVEGAKLRG